MTTEWIQPCRLMVVLMIVLGVLTGCASVFQNIDDKIHRKRFKSDYAALENALAVYDEGDFEKARARFKALSAASAGEKIARKAWLGEICCSLMLAKTQADYTATIGMWHEFGKSVPENEAVWDVALLDPLIVRMTPKNITRMIENHPPAAQISDETAAPPNRQQDGRQQADRQIQAELAILKKKVEDAEQLQRKMDAVVAENRSLKEKIRALEAIDQNIQKKKTEISAPSE